MEKSKNFKQMNKVMKKFQKSLKRILEANLNMEHYWFFPKPIVVPVRLEKETKRNKHIE